MGGMAFLLLLFVVGLCVFVARTGNTLVEEFTEEPVMKINEACEAYRPQVEAMATEYGMSDYVDLILAVMMQESSGHGVDVMQSSECQFNDRYPRKPNGIQDTEYSIACGIQELHHALVLAGATGPEDMEAIGLAVQGYNFGSDSYISYMKEHGQEQWSHETASDFAKMASGGVLRKEEDGLYQSAGEWNYGDQYYAQHVLQYYHPNGKA